MPLHYYKILVLEFRVDESASAAKKIFFLFHAVGPIMPGMLLLNEPANCLIMMRDSVTWMSLIVLVHCLKNRLSRR